MTPELSQKYTSLIESLRVYISQEHKKGSWITSDAETYAYFVQQAAQLKTVQKVAPTVSKPTPQPYISPPPPQPAKLIEPPKPSPKNELVTPLTRNVSPPQKTENPPPPDLPAAKKPAAHPKQFVREAMAPPAEADFSLLRSFFQENFPQIQLVDQVADDSGAKAVADNWKAPGAEVLILAFSESPMEKAFLSNLALAVGKTLASTKVIAAIKIEQENGWERLLKAKNLRLVIANHNSLHTLPELMKYFHEDAAGRHTLGAARIHLLSDISLYMQEPSLKIALWKTLRSQLI